MKETASLVASASSGTETLIRSVDITDFAALTAVAAEVGKWDVLVIASVYASAASTIVSTDVDEWWQGFEASGFMSFPFTLAPEHLLNFFLRSYEC